MRRVIGENIGNDARRVVKSTIFMAVLQVGTLASTLFQRRLGGNSLVLALINFGMGVVIPIIGYCGARRKITSMMFCFCGTNWALAIGQLSLGAILITTIFGTNLSISASCDASCRSIGCGTTSKWCSCEADCMRTDMLCCNDFLEFCPLPGAKPAERMHCADLESSLVTAAVVVTVALVLVLTPGIIISCYAGWYGASLWRRLAQDEACAALTWEAATPPMAGTVE